MKGENYRNLHVISYTSHALKGLPYDQRGEIIIKMAERGISCNVHYKPLPLLTVIKIWASKWKIIQILIAFFENEITLPLHGLLSDRDVDYIAK